MKACELVSSVRAVNPEALEKAHQKDVESCERDSRSLRHVPQTPRCAYTKELPHDQAQVERTHVKHETLEDVVTLPKVEPAHTSSVI